jgi:hypothetical protein
MVVVKESQYRTVEWHGTLTGAEPIDKQYSNGTFRPTTISVVYDWKDGQWVVRRVVLAGPQVKKDGTDSRSMASSDYYGIHEKYYDGPDWARDIALEHTPACVA